MIQPTELGYKLIGTREGTAFYKMTRYAYIGRRKSTNRNVHRAFSTGRPNQVVTDAIKVFPNGTIAYIRRYTGNTQGQNVSWLRGTEDNPHLKLFCEFVNGKKFLSQ